MYTIAYMDGANHATKSFSGNRKKLAFHLAQFQYPIVGVYEQATMISRAIKDELRKWSGVLDMSKAALDFINSPA